MFFSRLLTLIVYKLPPKAEIKLVFLPRFCFCSGYSVTVVKIFKYKQILKLQESKLGRKLALRNPKFTLGFGEENFPPKILSRNLQDVQQLFTFEIKNFTKKIGVLFDLLPLGSELSLRKYSFPATLRTLQN